MLAGVGAGTESGIHHLLPHPGRRRGQSRHPVDDVGHEVVPVEIVEHEHVEGGRRRALLLVASHVQVGMPGAAVGEAVDEP